MFSFLSHYPSHNGCHPIPARQIDVNTLVKHNCQVVHAKKIASLDHMHGKGVFHRDIKVCHTYRFSFSIAHLFIFGTNLLPLPMKFQPENIFVEKHGKHLKLADFGSNRRIIRKPPSTEYISTRYYRPPECLFNAWNVWPRDGCLGLGCWLHTI